MLLYLTMSLFLLIKQAGLLIRPIKGYGLVDLGGVGHDLLMKVLEFVVVCTPHSL